MPSRRHRLVWTPGPGGSTSSSRSLAERLAPLEEDRASTAGQVVLEASAALREELHTSAEPWGWDAGRTLLSATLAPMRAAHAWRGPVARWFWALDELVARGEAGRLAAPPRELLAEELGLWLGGMGAGEDDWDGEPLSEGRRLPDRARVAEGLLLGLEQGEVVLVHGWSETVLLMLEEAQARGLCPEVVLTEGGPDLGGRRMARRLVNAGAKVRMVYDAALAQHVGRADRVWVGTEALGAGAFVARVGTRALLEEARRREVPSAVLTTSDKVTPRGELELPAWCAAAGWLLWEHAPEGVRVESQAFEAVPLDLPDRYFTEHGPLGASELALRALHLSRSLT
jgi:Initiation factor 2 subunit family